MSYADFIRMKGKGIDTKGIDAPLLDYSLMPHQIDLTMWALN